MSKRRRVVGSLVCVWICGSLAACSSDGSSDSDQDLGMGGSGGDVSTGGSSASSGGQSTGGQATGGQSTGGSNSGGAASGGNASGGTQNTGGDFGTGGEVSTGGTQSTGGSESTGGSDNSGGSVGTGGNVSTGGSGSGGESTGGTGGTMNACPTVSTIYADPAATLVVGETAVLSADIDDDGVPSAATYAWSSDGGVLSDADTESASLECSGVGTVQVTLQVNDGECSKSVSITCVAPAAIKVNEVESNGGVPGDWIELYNSTPSAVDLSGWLVKDNDNNHVSVIPNGTVIAAGGYYVVEEAALGFGLGGGDSARLYDQNGVLIDSYTWAVHASTTYARCPIGTGAFATSYAVSKGAANVCEAPPTIIPLPWPGQNSVTTVDGTSVFGSNLSGLYYEPASGMAPPVLWGVRNGPSTLYRLEYDGSTWASAEIDGWDNGKTLRYSDGTGQPDSEGVAIAEYSSPAIYVASERNNDANTISRLSILRYDRSASGTSLTATNDWNITADLPVAGPNLGLEGITWVPDSYLVARSFRDDTKNKTYAPADYPDHGTGLFLIGVEGTGMIYVYALDQTGNTFARVASVASGFPGVMEVAFDREVGYLWAVCDDTCQGQTHILEVDDALASPTFGKFVVRGAFERPSSMASLNNEGFTMAPESECSGGFKSVFWSDDGETGGHSIRHDSIPCGAFF